MFTTLDLVHVALAFTAFGFGIGLMAANWRPKKKANYQPSYFKGDGEPQPGEWSPLRAVGHEPVRVYPSIEAWAKGTHL
jgi:hypothetical protein